MNTCDTLQADFTLDLATVGIIEKMQVFIGRTEQVCRTTRRRVLHGETVPNAEKLFGIFEPHTQLYRRGKAGEPNQYGRLVLFYEDGAGFITHHHVLNRESQDADVIIEQTRTVQERLGNAIESLSVDRGFHSPENQAELAAIVPDLCLPMRGSKNAAKQDANATQRFHDMKRRHSGIESAIGALQSGNGLARCRDSTEEGFKRYVALAVLGRNLHTLGRLLLARSDPDSNAAHSQRQAA
jgi:transposase, IS5 family